MRDEIDGRMWVDHGADFCEQMAQLMRRAAGGWRRLQAIRYDAPWRVRRVSKGC